MDQAITERRFKMLIVSDEILLTVMRCALNQYPKVLEVPVLEDVPKECTIWRVDYLPDMAAFGFILAHDSFFPVGLGECIPNLVSVFHNVTVELKHPVIPKDVGANLKP
jgi:hypothetical protein